MYKRCIDGLLQGSVRYRSGRDCLVCRANAIFEWREAAESTNTINEDVNMYTCNH